jgi:hypothetical protein
LSASSLAATSGGSGSDDGKLFENASLTALTYKTQLVAGTNYFVKAKIGEMIFHVRIYKDLQGNLKLSKVVGPKTEEDKIEYF